MGGDFANLDADVLSRWPTPNHVNPERRSWFPPFSITIAVTATLILGLRIHSQIRATYRLSNADDLLICFAWVFAIIFTVTCLMGTLTYGFDRHIWDIELTLYNRAAFIEWLSEGAFTISTCLTKVSVLFFYRRLDPPCTRAYGTFIRFFIVLTACYTTACLLTEVLLCRPIGAYWTVPKPGGSPQQVCTSQRVYYPVQGALGCLTTLYCIAIPYLGLRDIPMSKPQRTGLSCITIASLSVFGAGLARTVFLFRVADSDLGDATWNGFNVFIVAQLECHLALIFASLPFLAHLILEDASIPMTTYLSPPRSRKNSIMSNLTSSLPTPTLRFPFMRAHHRPRKDEVSRPMPPMSVEIPEWEFQSLESPRATTASPITVDEISYEQYVLGKYGPPVPPKDSRALFDEWRRAHGEMV